MEEKIKEIILKLDKEGEYKLPVEYQDMTIWSSWYRAVFEELELDIDVDVCGYEDQYLSASINTIRNGQLYFIQFDLDVGTYVSDDTNMDTLIGYVMDIVKGYNKCKEDFNL